MSQMMTTANNMCVLNGRDGINVIVPLAVAKVSITIRNMLEDLGEILEEGQDNNIPVPGVKGAILDKIYIFCNYIHTNPQELDTLITWTDDKTYTFPLPEWYNEFLNIDQATLFEVILGANFLDIQPLLNMTCKYIANIIRNKTPDELKILFKNPDEEEPVPQAADASAASPDDEATTDVVDA
jgi:S-phase kinase-associated protein 1